VGKDTIGDRQPTLPANRAFVVHFRPGESGGRIEHVVSGATASFESWEHLQRFVEQVLLSTKGGADT